MKLEELREILQAEVLYGNAHLSKEISMASAADLLSDVLAFAKADSLLITGLSNTQVVRTAEMVDISAICFVRGKRPDEATIELAKEKNIPLLCTELPMYEACGRIYKCGIPGRCEY